MFDNDNLLQRNCNVFMARIEMANSAHNNNTFLSDRPSYEKETKRKTRRKTNPLLVD